MSVPAVQYAGRQRWYRSRRGQTWLLAFCSSLCAFFAVGIWLYRDRVQGHFRAYRLSQACMTYSQPAGTIAHDLTGTTLITPLEAMLRNDPALWLGGGAEPTIFLHGLRTASGTTRIVIVQLDSLAFQSRSISPLITILEPASWTRPAQRSTGTFFCPNSLPRLREASLASPSTPLRAEFGQIDRKDPSRFSIVFECGDIGAKVTGQLVDGPVDRRGKRNQPQILISTRDLGAAWRQLQPVSPPP